ncbi:hypothetical protein SAMN05444398_112100 [Roseovarius pacificus]|uniref:Uncharacterized protein n=1 Tax=Roseovarius pacificus TaxID=337701 RepID=A0A1M7HDY7_9RHOB|nr:hypothetical protein [Roseovarius pacificus]GGO58366.1 hypothetical protein GCM10011315_27760 [Roseovarius pacificus]SHM26553.1 hypothetical protein SAMN05444398_112100 [Roseovarius pacificus]
MFHSPISDGTTTCATKTSELALRSFLSDHDTALGDAANLLADRQGVRLVNAIRDALDQPGPLTRRVRRMLLELRDMLFLEHTNGDWEDVGFFAMLEPEDPIVPELCLLADGLDDALRAASVIPDPEERAA